LFRNLNELLNSQNGGIPEFKIDQHLEKSSHRVLQEEYVFDGI
jgi:hypothetical protein